jgi:hypothetical protein
MGQLELNLVERVVVPSGERRYLCTGRWWSFDGEVREAIDKAIEHFRKTRDERYIRIRLSPEDYEKAQVKKDEERFIVAAKNVQPGTIYLILSED